MNADELIAEGERLVRPCLSLSDDCGSGRYSGIWAGTGVLKPKPGPWKHWITVDCSWLAKQGVPLTGILSVYTNEDDCLTGIVVHDPSARLPKSPTRGAFLDNHRKRLNNLGWAGRTDKLEDIALYGREVSSFPPISTVSFMDRCNLLAAKNSWRPLCRGIFHPRSGPQTRLGPRCLFSTENAKVLNACTEMSSMTSTNHKHLPPKRLGAIQ